MTVLIREARGPDSETWDRHGGSALRMEEGLGLGTWLLWMPETAETSP